MSTTAEYTASVTWKGAHLGQVELGNGPVLDFSAPPDAQGCAGVLTPEDAFVAAVNSCIMLMFLWACERFKIRLLRYECEAVGTKLVELDRTEIFTRVRLAPQIRVDGSGEDSAELEKRVRRALLLAQKYSLVANSIKSAVEVTAQVFVEEN